MKSEDGHVLPRDHHTLRRLEPFRWEIIRILRGRNFSEPSPSLTCNQGLDHPYADCNNGQHDICKANPTWTILHSLDQFSVRNSSMWFASHTCFVPQILGIECELFLFLGQPELQSMERRLLIIPSKTAHNCVGNSYLAPAPTKPTEQPFG